MRASRLLPAVAAGSLMIAACGGTSDGDAAISAAEPIEQAATDTAAPAADPITAGEPAPDGEPATAPASLQFTAPLVGGGEIDATTLAGKPTLFWFWAPN